MNMLPNDLDLNLLLALDRLLATSSVTAAAKELGLSQPAMSRTLQRLRNAVDDPVLVRSGRGMVPTERARQLEPAVTESLAAARRVFERQGPFEPNTATGEVRIAVGDEVQASFADAILEALWAEAPGLNVRFRRLGYESVEESRRGFIELALTLDLNKLPATAGRLDLSEFVVKPVYERKWVVVTSREHARRRWTLESYAKADHLLVGPEASGRGFIDDLLEAQGHRRRVAATVTTFHAAAYIVARTRLVSTLPLEVVGAAGIPLVISEPPIEIPRVPMMLVWHPRFTTDARHRFIREAVARAIAARAKEFGGVGRRTRP